MRERTLATKVVLLLAFSTTTRPSVLTTHLKSLSVSEFQKNLSELTLTVEDFNYIVDENLANRCFGQTFINLQLNLKFLEIDYDRTDRADSADEGDNLICNFNFDFTYLKSKESAQFTDSGLPPNFRDEYTSFICKLQNTSQICDGYSQCLTDECNCLGNQSPVFYCADGSGCVAMDNLCDKIQDCTDGSDECFCSDYFVLSSSGSAGKICVSEDRYCQDINTYRSSEYSIEVGNPNLCNEKQDFATHLSPLHTCLLNCQEHDQHFTIAEFCHANCTHVDGFENGWENFCDHIWTGYPILHVFRCKPKDFTEIYSLHYMCDGEVNCDNQADEMGCPGRFYCSPNKTNEWVDEDKICDNVKDCVNGADECGTCQFEELSSSDYLIKSNFVFAATTIMGILIVIMNMKEGYKCWTMKCNTKIKQVDNVFLMQIFFHDTLMGVYMCCIVIAALVLSDKGEYCQLEEMWRASPFCSVLGVVFSFSSHGSLMLIASISITRFLSCYSIVVDIRVRVIVMWVTFLNILNLLHSILPLMPVSAIRDIFRTKIFFSHLDQNPFFGTNPINRSRLAMVHKGMLHRDDDDDIYRMISDLSNVTSSREIFDVTEISYYGNTGFCVHNIFKSQDSYEIYKLTYCASIVVLLSIVITAYIKIILKQRHSNEAIVARGREGQDSVRVQLTLKVALMVGSQLICWTPFILTVLYFQYISKKPASATVFEIFALLVIPINSFLNPVFHSELYKTASIAVWKKWRQFVDYLAPMGLRIPENT